MALTPGDKAECKELARDIIGEIIKEVMINHIQGCPHGHVVSKAKWVIIGLGLGASAAGGGGLVAGILALIK